MSYRPTPSGTGVDKIVSGVEQSTASTVVDSDVSSSANIAGSKLQAASGSNAGTLSSADYNKIPASGDVSVSSRAATVTAIQGQSVAAGVSSGQLLQFNGTSWALKSGFTGTSSQLAAGDGSNVSVGSNLTLSGGVLSASGGGGSSGPWGSTSITGTANGVATFNAAGNPVVLAEPADKTNRVLGWSGGVLTWVVATVAAVVIPTSQPYEKDTVVANPQFTNTSAGVTLTLFSGTVV